MGAGTSSERSPYQAALQGAFDSLDPQIQRAHAAPCTAEGTFDVEHGSHWWVPVLVRALKLPAAGRSQPVRLEVTTLGAELVWTRRIGGVRVRTRQRAVGSSIVERSGPGEIAFRLAADNGALVYQQESFRIAGIPLPASIAPHVSARASAAPRGWHVDVRVTWRAHLVCRYHGGMSQT